MVKSSSGLGARGTTSRRLLAIGASALAAVAVAATSASVAEAEEQFHLELNRAELRLGSIDPLTPGYFQGDRVTLDGDIDPATGGFTASVETVANGGNALIDGVSFPIECTPAADLGRTPQTCSYPSRLALGRVEAPVTGTFDEATGELEMTMLADLRVASPTSGWPTDIEGGPPSCEFEDVEWNLSTSNTFGPLLGVPFLDGLDGSGAVVASWEDLPPVTPGGGSERCDELLRPSAARAGSCSGMWARPRST